MGLGIPSLKIKIVLESNPLKSTMLVGGLGVCMLCYIILRNTEGAIFVHAPCYVMLGMVCLICGFDYNFTNYNFNKPLN